MVVVLRAELRVFFVFFLLHFSVQTCIAKVWKREELNSAK